MVINRISILLNENVTQLQIQFDINEFTLVAFGSLAAQ